jgi:hypothetical protein
LATAFTGTNISFNPASVGVPSLPPRRVTQEPENSDSNDNSSESSSLSPVVIFDKNGKKRPWIDRQADYTKKREERNKKKGKKAKRSVVNPVGTMIMVLDSSEDKKDNNEKSEDGDQGMETGYI